MKKIKILFVILLFSIAGNAKDDDHLVAHANGKPSTTQDGNGLTITVHCIWMWWNDCWDLYSDGRMVLGDGRIIGGAKIISSEDCDNPELCEYASSTVVSFEYIE